MPFDPHQRARFLIDESRIAGIPAEDSAWLRSHLSECTACAQQDAITARMLGAMNEMTFVARASRPARPVSITRRPAAWRWPLAVAATLLLAAVPLYKSARDARQSEADALLLERVSDQVSRTVPQALEPLMQSGEPQ